MIRFTEDSEDREYYIVFDRHRGCKMFWNYFTSSGFDHIYLFTSIGTQTIAIHPTPSECVIDLWQCTIEEAISWIPDDTTAILKYTAKYESLKRYNARGIVSCVSFAKYLLGIGGITFTPQRLYNQLIKLGAENGRKKKTSTSRPTDCH